MAKHRKIPPGERYRSTVLTYLCKVTQAEGLGFRELPDPLLSRLGAEVIELGKRCRTLLVVPPREPHGPHIRRMLEEMEVFIAGHPSRRKGAHADERNRRARQKAAGFEGLDALSEGILTTIMPKGGLSKRL